MSMGKRVASAWNAVPEGLKKYKYVLLVVVVGLILLLWPNAPPGGGAESDGGAPVLEAQDGRDISGQLERRIEQALSEVDGVGRVSVVLTLKRDMETQYAEDSDTRERRQWAGSALQSYEQDGKSSTVMRKDAGGGEQPLIKSRVYPVYQGALVVCDGAGDAGVRTRVMEAVASLTGLGYDKISVAGMKPEAENGKE